MERLTYTDEEMEEMPGVDCPVKQDDGSLVQDFCGRVCEEFQHNCPFEEMGKKLKAYEDAEEQGLLLILLCKVGDKIYKIPSKVNYDLNIVNRHPEINKVYEQSVCSIEIWSDNTYILNTCDGLDCVRSDSFKETWFLTKAEAEKALAEMDAK